MKSPSVAIIIKHGHRFNEACQCGKSLSASGMGVSYYCIQANGPSERWGLPDLLEITPECFTTHGELAARYGIEHLSLTAMARAMDRFDWVIPY